MTDVGGISGDQLLSYVQRYERLQEEIDALNDDRSELMKEVAGAGFDKKIFKIVIKRWRMGQDQCDEEDTLVELYERTLRSAPNEDGEASRAHATEEAPTAAVGRALRDFVRSVPNDTTMSVATSKGEGFAVTNSGGHRTVRRFGEEEEAAAP